MARERRIAVAAHGAQVAGEVRKSWSLRPFRPTVGDRSAQALGRGGGTAHRHVKGKGQERAEAQCAEVEGDEGGLWSIQEGGETGRGGAGRWRRGRDGGKRGGKRRGGDGGGEEGRGEASGGCRSTVIPDRGRRQEGGTDRSSAQREGEVRSPTANEQRGGAEQRRRWWTIGIDDELGVRRDVLCLHSHTDPIQSSWMRSPFCRSSYTADDDDHMYFTRQ